MCGARGTGGGRLHEGRGFGGEEGLRQNKTGNKHWDPTPPNPLPAGEAVQPPVEGDMGGGGGVG